MKKILSIKEASQKSKELRNQNKKIVLAGGCFDILHLGHLSFLNEAKAQGDLLIVMLEADATITTSKGEGRPLNTQQDRAQLVAALEMVDFVLPLQPLMKNDDYDALVFSIKPAIIATTKGDTYRVHKERQAKLIGAKVVDVTDAVENQSTTRIFKILNEI